MYMYNEFFENKFAGISGASTPERRDVLINHMITYFTMHVLSTIGSDDYVIPNYVRKLLNNYEFEYITTTPDEQIKVDFKDFTIIFTEKSSVEEKEQELHQKIMKNIKINYIILKFDELDDVKEVFRPKVGDGVDVLILDHGCGGGYIYVRDKRSPYLIHKFNSFDKNVYTAINEKNRSVAEFLTKVKSEYISSLFL